MPNKQPRRLKRRPNSSRPSRIGWRGRLILATCAVFLVVLAWAAIARMLAPDSNTALTRFDAIIVLGTRADSDGNPTPEQLARVAEGVHEYELGIAPRLILTGGAAYNQFVEARVMAQSAHAMGIPDSAIFIEPQALDSIQNACYSVRIMRAHGWRSAEIVSSAAHLPRAGLIFSRLPLEWRAHSAPALQPESEIYSNAVAAVEILRTVRYLVFARQFEQCEP